jgi:O-antigen/teichoic acid export membrane protein
MNGVRAAPSPAVAAPCAPVSAVAEHVRGSVLLFTGRVLALGLGFLAQVLMVRYLSKGDFGAFSYALSIVALLQGFAMLEMSSAVSRFVPLYRERGQYRALFGTILLAPGVVVALGTVTAGAVIAGVTVFGLQPTADPQALRLLAILALLIPIQGLDNLFTSLFAAFGSSRAILLQSVLAPALRLGLVAGMIALAADVVFLTTGYLLVSLAGVLLYTGLFLRLLRRQNLPSPGSPRRFAYPWRDLFGFALPLLTSTLVWTLMESSDGVLLGYFQGSQAVADFRAVLPMAQLNLVVSMSFATLYMPMAARLYARADRAGLADLYWQTALWMTVLAFPIFVLTFSFAPSVTLGIYGAPYAASAPILALLSFGYFFQTALGFNGLTIKVLKQLRYVVTIDLAAAALNIGINLLLIPRWGAWGAAAGTAGTMIVHNLLKQFGLWKYAGINPFRARYARVYLAVGGLAGGLLGLQAVLPPTLWIALPLGAAAGLLLVWISRRGLQVSAMFPELARLPGVGAIFQSLGRQS